MPRHWVKCDTKDCDAKFVKDTSDVDTFRAEVTALGWDVATANTFCPDCNPLQTAEESEHPILVVPLASGGAFTAYCPPTMTAHDWATVEGICKAMAGGRGVLG